MGHEERLRIKKTIYFVSQLEVLGIHTGCLQAALVAMGAHNVHLYDVISQFEARCGIRNINAYLHTQGFTMGWSGNINTPISTGQVRSLLEHPRVS